MSRRFLALIVLLGGLLWGGCTSSGSSLTRPDGQGVHVYDHVHLPEAAYDEIGDVVGEVCKTDVYSKDPSRADALSALRQQAGRAGANGVVEVTCRKTRTSSCARVRRCTGTAVRVQSVEETPRIARTEHTDQLGDEERSGTGWVLAPGLIVTSHRLVKGRSSFSVAVADTTISARLVAQDKTHNLALLQPVESARLPPPLALARDPEPVGTQVFAAGYPEPTPAGVRVASGIVSAQSGALGDARVYQTTLPLWFEPGGAPLLNDRGEVVGVLVPHPTPRGFNVRSSSESASYAVKNEYLRPLRAQVDEHPASPGRPASRTRAQEATSSLPALLDRVRPSILRVIAQ